MLDKLKFPNDGYEVTVCRKQDILDCLDANIVDKEVVLAVISQCELDASNFIKSGRWTGLPFLGSVRTPKVVEKMNTPEIQSLLKDARDNLDGHRYYIFRKQLGSELKQEMKADRHIRYIVSSFVNANRLFYNKKVKELGELGAQLVCYTLTNPTIGGPIEKL